MKENDDSVPRGNWDERPGARGAPLTALPAIEVLTGEPAQGAVIWLHGLGADGRDFVPVVRALGALGLPPLRFILPSAPARPVTINGGVVMPAWFDLYSLNTVTPREDAAGLARAARALGGLVARELERGVPRERLFLAGFSQGGALALYAALRLPYRIGGVIALSTWLPLARETPAAMAANVEAADLGASAPEISGKRGPAPAAQHSYQGLPVFLAHGEQDPVLPPAVAQLTRARLEALGCRVRFESYAMGHAACEAEVRDLADWFMREWRRAAD